MIITRTPFRISFFGGGTDYPGWYKENGGTVLSTTIDKYCYISCRPLPPFFKYKHRIVYSKTENAKDTNKIIHPSVRECIRFIDLDHGLEIHHDGDLPARSGLGSSSSFTVGMIHALYGLKGMIKSKRDLALDAIHVEQDLIGENVGSQDQIAAAYGGFNKIDLSGAHVISVQPVIMSPERLNHLQDHMMLFFTGLSRNASEVAKTQIKNIPKTRNELTAMTAIANEGFSIIKNQKPVEEFGKLLKESWQYKRKLSKKISNEKIDTIYATAMKAGALGGKLLGAGGGGFILFFAPPEIQPKIKEKLKKLLCVPFRFENQGSQIIYYNR